MTLPSRQGQRPDDLSLEKNLEEKILHNRGHHLGGISSCTRALVVGTSLSCASSSSSLVVAHTSTTPHPPSFSHYSRSVPSMSAFCTRACLRLSLLLYPFTLSSNRSSRSTPKLNSIGRR